MREGFARRGLKELDQMLGHFDRRVRLFAQYEIGGRDARAAARVFLRNLKQAGQRERRLHGIWGLWQIGLTNQTARRLAAGAAASLSDPDPEIRAQVARVLGDLRIKSAAPALISLLADDAARARYFAAEALGKIGSAQAVPGLLEQIRRYSDDPAQRHAATLALSRVASPGRLARLAKGQSTEVRMGIVLALRRQQAGEIQSFLNDPDPPVTWEAARAIHDLPIAAALPALAASELLADPTTPFPVAHRVLNANFRLGGRSHLRRLAEVAGDAGLSLPLRREAMLCLERWLDPSPFDRVTWHYRPLKGDRESAVGPVIEGVVRQYLFGPSQPKRKALRQIAGRLAVRYALIDPDSMARLARDPSLDAQTRAAFLNRLLTEPDARAKSLCRALLKDASLPLRLAAARPLLRERDAAAEALVEQLWNSRDAKARQGVVRIVADLDTPFALRLLRGQMGKAGATALDVLEAALQSPDAQLKSQARAWLDRLRRAPNPLGEFVLTLSGGDPESGRRIFTTHAIQCVRCHQVKGFGGQAGPDLSKIGRVLKPEQIVEALIDPSARIAEGFGAFEFELNDGESVAGFLRSENDRTVKLALMDGRVIELAREQIRRRSDPQSSMPSMREALTRREIRDLVAYLSSLK